MSEVLSLISPLEVNKLLESIKNTSLNNGTIYVLGNGGSASTASHFVNDLTIITMRRGINIKAISLVDSIATITAIGNDESFDDIFKTQLLNRLEKKDLVFSISASGNSSNLINAVKFANEIGTVPVKMLSCNNKAFRTGKELNTSVIEPVNKLSAISNACKEIKSLKLDGMLPVN